MAFNIKLEQIYSKFFKRKLSGIQTAMDHLIYSKILVIFLFLLNLCVIFGAAVADAGVVNVQLNIAIIGAGPGGLFSAKHSLAHGHRVTVYEQSDAIGGVWVYTNQTGENQYGLNIHTAMYKGLR